MKYKFTKRRSIGSYWATQNIEIKQIFLEFFYLMSILELQMNDDN